MKKERMEGGGLYHGCIMLPFPSSPSPIWPFPLIGLSLVEAEAFISLAISSVTLDIAYYSSSFLQHHKISTTEKQRKKDS